MDIKINENSKILIIAPHQDDETIGCGGLLTKYGKQCDILLLTDGRNGVSQKYTDKEKLIEIRNKELDKAMKIAHVNTIYRLNIENDTLTKNKNMVYQFDIRKYDCIFVPNKYEAHKDYQPVLKIALHMKFKQRAKAQIYEYEVWTPLRYPTYIMNISKEIERKKKMLLSYKSQMNDKNYLDGPIGLNAYRGMQANHEYAEAYKIWYFNDFAGFIYPFVNNNLNKIKTLLNKLGK